MSTTTAKLSRSNKLVGFPEAGPRKLHRLHGETKDKPYSLFKIKPLSPTIGVEISDIDLSIELTPALRSELHRALLEWKVLFFRDQNINYKQHISFARNWGDLEIHPFYASGESPEIVRFHRHGNLEDKEAQGYENEWHTDTSWREQPSLGSVLRCVECPSLGGDTLWADMYAAYDNLPTKLQSYLEPLYAEHDAFNAFQDTRENRKKLPHSSAIHPVIRVHPDTKRKLLYVNRSFTTKIIGVHPHESVELLAGLLQQAMIPEYQCRFKWQPKSVAFWDNRPTNHYANSDYFPSTRIMERVTIIGEKPVGVTRSSKL